MASGAGSQRSPHLLRPGGLPGPHKPWGATQETLFGEGQAEELPSRAGLSFPAPPQPQPQALPLGLAASLPREMGVCG